MKQNFFSFFSVALLISLFGFNSCKKDPDENTCVQNKIAPCSEDTSKINFRIKNSSDYNFCNVLVNTSNEEMYVGSIDKKGTTCYRSVDTAYAHAYIRFLIGSREFEFQTIDFVGEPLLSKGKHTYAVDVLDYEKGILGLTLE